MVKYVLLPVLLIAFPFSLADAALTCSVTSNCSNVTVFRLSSTTNAHAEMAAQSNYDQAVCCSGITGLGNACSGNFSVVSKLSSVTNAQVEEPGQANFGTNACLSAPAGNTIIVGYQAGNCTGFDTPVVSLSAATNAHAGQPSVYSNKICAKVLASQSLSFSISDNSIGFGTLNSGSSRFATGNGLGSASETEAHSITVSTNASYGYSLLVKGGTLNANAGLSTINAIGGTNTTSLPGTEQFGLRLTAAGGAGTVTVPYAAIGFAYAATANSTSQVAGSNDGDAVDTVYSARYLANISSDSESAQYSATLTYIITANF